MNFITIVEEDERTPKHFGESTIWYRRYSSAVHKKLEKQFRKRKKNRQGEFYWDIDDDGLNDAIIDHIFIDLEKVKDGKGGFVETTLETKLSLPSDVVGIIMEESGAASIMKSDDAPDPTQKTSDAT